MAAVLTFSRERQFSGSEQNAVHRALSKIGDQLRLEDQSLR
jgi:hypothetical protein